MRILLVFAFLFLPLSVFAQSIVINEIAWMGSMVDGVDPSQYWRYEWLELYSTTVRTMVLDGWKIELYRGEKPEFTISLAGAIAPDGYFLIGASDKIQGLDLNYKNLAGKFNNAGQKVVLKNNAGEIVDEVDATKGWPAGDNKTKQTMERVVGSDPATWQTSKDSGGTPKVQSSKGVQPKLSFLKGTKFQQPVALKPSETKKDLRGSSFNSSPLSTALPGALLAGVLALAARKFLYKA